MNLRERQDEFIAVMSGFDGWMERYGWLMERGSELPFTCPEPLLPFRIVSCQSRSHFMAESGGGLLHVAGWSNAGTIRGMIACIAEMFDGIAIDDLCATDIDFHIKSGLMDNMTSMRRDGLAEMLNRIKAA